MSNNVASYMNKAIADLNASLCSGCESYRDLFFSGLSDYNWERVRVPKHPDVYRKPVENSRFSTTIVGNEFAIVNEKGRRVNMENVPKEAVLYISQHITQIKEVLETVNSI